MVDLDDKQGVLKSQGGDAVITSVDGLFGQLKQSFEESLKTSFPPEFKTVKNVVVCGMGGSRFTPLIVKELLKDKFKVPYEINDNYTLPGYVNSDTLIIMSSYSGTTEEVIHCGNEALKRGAKVAGISAGGEVAQILKENNLPGYIFNPLHNPSGQPRIGFGYLVGGHLGFLASLGLADFSTEEVAQAIQNTQQLTSKFKLDISKQENPAKQIAEKLYGRYPYYIVSEFLNGVGNAVANQTNETAKSISSFRVIPELNHHLMEGLKHPDELLKIATFVFFFSNLYSGQVQKRYKITKEVVEQNKVQTLWHELQGKTKLEQTFELMSFGGYLSMYLSALYEEDPTVIPYVDYFKKKLKEI